MSPIKLAAIKSRAEAATPGPWIIGVNPDNHYQVIATDEPEPYYICDLAEGTPGDTDDGVFIAHAREDIPRLVSEVEQLQELYNSCVAFGEQLPIEVFEALMRIE